MTAPTLVLPGGPAHRDDPRAWTIPPTTPDVHAWREQQHARRGGLIASMRLRNAEKFALEAARKAEQEKAATPAPKPARRYTERPRPAADKHERWRRMYEQGLTSQQIADLDGVPSTSVLSGLRAAGATLRTGHRYHANPLDAAAAVAEYQAGASIASLARRYRVHPQRIRAALADAGITKRPHGGQLADHWTDPAFVARVNDLLDGGMSQAAVAREVGVHQRQVQRHAVRRRKGEA